MPTATNRVTALELAAMPSCGPRYELVEGQLRMMPPAGVRHGWIAMRIGALLQNHVFENDLGAVFAAETGFLIQTDPDTVRAPDVAFLSNERLEQVATLDGYLPVAPDLAIEIVSPNDSSSEVEGKANMWLQAGAKMVLVVDPAQRTIRVYREVSTIVVLQSDELLDAKDVVPGWEIRVADAFPLR